LTKGYDKSEHYKNLVTDVGQKFPVDKIIYRWVAGDMMPRDHLPYIGLYPKQSSVYVITGFHAWGLTWRHGGGRDDPRSNQWPGQSFA